MNFNHCDQLPPDVTIRFTGGEHEDRMSSINSALLDTHIITESIRDVYYTDSGEFGFPLKSTAPMTKVRDILDNFNARYYPADI